MPTSMRMKATFGIGDHLRNREIHPGSIASRAASLVARCRVSPPATSTVRPSICLSSSAWSRATRSITFACNAALAERLAASAPLSPPNRHCGRASRQGCGSGRRRRSSPSLPLHPSSSAAGRRRSSFPYRPCQGEPPADRAAGRQSAPASLLRDWCPAPWPRYAWRRGYRFRRWPHGLRRARNVTDNGNAGRQHVCDNLAHAGRETARRIQTQNDDLGMSFACLGQGVFHVTGRCRPDRSFDRDGQRKLAVVLPRRDGKGRDNQSYRCSGRDKVARTVCTARTPLSK